MCSTLICPVFSCFTGDVLFVPAGCPHQVETLEPSVAVSSNFIDQSNLDASLSELRAQGLIDSRAKDLYKQLTAIVNKNFP